MKMSTSALNDVMVRATTSAWDYKDADHATHRPSLLHPTFYWGYQCEVLFHGWPGSSRGMYAVAVIFVFSLSVLVEWLTRLTDQNIKPGANKLAACAFRTGMFAVRSGFTYMVILSVMSFNGGIFLAAVFGHTFGFMIFRGRALAK